jgi:hypothetical protein
MPSAGGCSNYNCNHDCLNAEQTDAEMNSRGTAKEQDCLTPSRKDAKLSARAAILDEARN